MYREVKLVDTLDDKPSPKAAKGQLKISKEKNLEILRNVKDMDFQLTGFSQQNEILMIMFEKTQKLISLFYIGLLIRQWMI